MTVEETNDQKRLEKKLKEKDLREFPCEACQTGEYQLVSTIPSNLGSTMVYECNHCGHEVRFP